MIPGAIVWLAVLWFLSRVDESTSVITLILAWLVFTSAMAAMWAPLTTSAMGALRTELYPHGTAAFATVQQLAGAGFGAVFISAYTIGSGAGDAGVLTTAQAESAGHAAFITAWAIGLLVLAGALFVGRTPTPADDGTAAEGTVTAAPGPVSGGTASGASATDEAICKTGVR